MSQLMTRSLVVHEGPLLNLVGLLIDDVALIGKDGSNVIFFLLATDKENLVLGLNRCKFLRQNIRISDRNLNGSLGVELVDQKGPVLLIVIM